MNLYAFSVLCFAYGSLLTAILALAKNRSKVSIRFLCFTITISVWGSLFSIWINQQYSPETALLLIRISYIFVIFIPVTWLHFVFEFIGKKEPFKYFFAFNYIFSTVLVFFCPTRLMFPGVGPFSNFRYLPMMGPAHHIHLTHYAIIVFYGLHSLLKAYSKAQGYEKIQMRFYVIGVVIGFVSGSTIYFPFYRIPFSSLDLLVLLPLYPIFTGIALIRYELFDIRQIADAFQREKLAMMGTLAASLNHELKTPLFIAMGRLQTYKEALERQAYKTQDEQLSKAGETIESVFGQLSRATDIMQRFLDFVRPSTKPQPRQKFEIETAVNEVLDLISHQVRTSEIQIQKEIEPGLQLESPKHQMEEIFLNLFMNACHAMGKKGTLGIKGYRTGQNVIIEISDTGRGISKENLTKIFDPFFTTKGDKGIGLGLYITKQLIDRCHGRINVTSDPGQGTTFTLEFNRP